ncbi:MAG: amidohydrolase family protein [Deltaproteobacteria bacterium]|nr:amidohydrolase family protein [Deltaproteobacteria bacterium]MBN2688444.1 amidohydrolase family protein [Deltaproteobacteria bacterium]
MNAVFAHTIYTGRSIVNDSFLLFNDDGIAGISKKKRGMVVGEYAVVTPAFIDPHSHIGMHRAGEPPQESESNEQLDSILTLSDALDSVVMDDQAFRDAIEMGVLYSCVVPGSGNIIGGRSAVIRHYGKNSSDALIGRAGVKAAFGYNPMSTQSWKGKRPSTRMGALALLRSRLDEVRQKMGKYREAKGAKKQDITFSSEEALLRDILEGKERLRVHVHKIDDIAALLRFVDEYKLVVTVEHALAVCEPDIYDELTRREIPVVYGPMDAFAYKVELKHENWRNVRHLVNSCCKYGLMTDHPVTATRTLFLQTRWFLRAGLTKQEAVELVSRKNAEILGIDGMLGTLEKGKWASFSCWNGDPFEMGSYPLTTYGEGRLLFVDIGK